jgi:hypothetical protein
MWRSLSDDNLREEQHHLHLTLDQHEGNLSEQHREDNLSEQHRHLTRDLLCPPWTKPFMCLILQYYISMTN